MKVILDTNVIIAAFATHGLCHLVFESVVAQHDLLLSEFLLGEVNEKLRTKLKLPTKRAEEIIIFLRNHAILGSDAEVPELTCRDPNDLRILYLAANTNADAIVTGDQDLLVLNSTATTAILAPRQFWDMLRAQ